MAQVQRATSAATELKQSIQNTYMPIFQNALFYSIANQASSVFIEKRPDSKVTLMLCIAIYLAAILVISITLSRFKATVTLGTHKPLITFILSFAIYITGLVATLLTQLESTLVARFAFSIFDEAANVSWAVAIGFVSSTLLFLARVSAFNSFSS